MFNEKILITQILNNNVVIATKGDQELIAIGNGIGFRHNKFERIDPSEIVKVYFPNSGSAKEQLLASLNSIPFEIIELANLISDMAESELKVKLSDNVVLTLADHINYAITRYRSGITTPIIIDEEVKRFYKQEYEIGIKALGIINEKYNVYLEREEASAIAFHLISAKEGSPAPETLKILEGVNNIVDIMSHDLNVKFDENSLDYSRLIIHLRFLLKKILMQKEFTESSDESSEMYENLLDNKKHIEKCINHISEYCNKTYKYELKENDKLYLLVHIMKNM